MIYDNLTDDELLRVADGQAGLIKALAERLEMRMRDIEELDKPTQVEDDRQLKLF
jgi:polyphosphate kinase 2 (PPK2 family)